MSHTIIQELITNRNVKRFLRKFDEKLHFLADFGDFLRNRNRFLVSKAN